jgi:hypothetical protein
MNNGYNNNKNEDTNDDDYTGSYSSPVFITRYAQKSIKLIGFLEKNFILIIGAISALGVLSVLDIIQAQAHIHILSDNGYDITVTVLSLISLAVFIPTVILLLKSRRILESWAGMFDRNSIKASMNIAMASKSKEEAIRAVSETIEEIGEPLQMHLSSSIENLKQFMDASVGGTDIVFDVLIDGDRISSKEDNLKQALREYGSIIIKVVDGTIDKNVVRSLYNLISRYTSLTKNNVALALIIGEEATQDAYKVAIQYENRKRIKHIVLVEKPILLP